MFDELFQESWYREEHNDDLLSSTLNGFLCHKGLVASFCAAGVGSDPSRLVGPFYTSNKIGFWKSEPINHSETLSFSTFTDFEK